MKKGVLLIGATYSEKLRTQLRGQQRQIALQGALVKSLLDFAKEGENEPDQRCKPDIMAFMALNTKYIVVGQPDAEWCPLIMELGRDLKIPVLEYRDLIFVKGKSPFKKSFIDKLNDRLRPWLTNPMKYRNQTTSTHTTSFK